MKQFVSVAAITVFAILSCKKDTSPGKQARAYFTVSATAVRDTNQASVAIVGTHDPLGFFNRSSNADSIRWDFGDGQTSNSYDAYHPYENAGIYTANLTVYNKNGTQSSFTRKVQAVERVIKKLTLTKLYLNKFLSPSKHTFVSADLWVEVKYAQNGEWDVVLPDGSMNLPIIYKSPVFTDVDAGFHGTLTYELPERPKTIIHYPVGIQFCIYPVNSRGTVVELWAKDNTGTYLMGTSWPVGLHILSGGGNPVLTDKFDLGYSVPDGVLANQIKLDCLFQ